MKICLKNNKELKGFILIKTIRHELMHIYLYDLEKNGTFYSDDSDYEDNNDICYDEEITEKTMLNKMITYIKDHKNMFKIQENISKEHFTAIFDSYIELLYDVKNNCRNGYFHKDRINKPKELEEKREKVLEAIAKTIIFMK